MDAFSYSQLLEIWKSCEIKKSVYLGILGPKFEYFLQSGDVEDAEGGQERVAAAHGVGIQRPHTRKNSLLEPEKLWTLQ